MHVTGQPARCALFRETPRSRAHLGSGIARSPVRHLAEERVMNYARYVGDAVLRRTVRNAAGVAAQRYADYCQERRCIHSSEWAAVGGRAAAGAGEQKLSARRKVLTHFGIKDARAMSQQLARGCEGISVVRQLPRRQTGV